MKGYIKYYSWPVLLRPKPQIFVEKLMIIIYTFFFNVKRTY